MILRTSIVILMFCEAGMLGLLGNSYAIPLVGMIAAMVLYYRPMELDVSLTTKILVPTGLIGYFFFRYVSVGELVTRSEWVFPSQITVSLAECFMLGQIFELIKKKDPDEGLLNFCLLAMAVVVCSCCRTASGSERSLLFVGSVICITLICTIFQYSTRTFLATDKTRKSDLAYRSTLVSATMGLIGLSSWYLSGTLQDNIEEFQSWWMKNFKVAGLQATESSLGFTLEATLQNITALKKSNPQNPTLHVYSEVPPGYLRGRAYDRFDGSSWKRQPFKRLVGPTQPPESIRRDDEACYQVSNTEFKRNLELRIENQANLAFLFMPLDPTYVAGQPSGRQQQIEIDVESVITQGLRSNHRYSAFVDETPPQVELSERDVARLTSLPRRLEDEVVSVARNIAGGNPTDAEKIESIENYFRASYTYSLKQKPFPSNRDQLSYFIIEKPAAHCEFFASAAVVFLRANGIPSRYVTGFAFDELSEDEDYYIARNQDAHAWAEAYDRDKKQWVIVEATPGTNLPKNIWDQMQDEDVDTSGADNGSNSAVLQTTWADFFRQSWYQIREFLEEIGRQLRGPINIAILSLITFTLLYKFWWKRRQLGKHRTREGILERERIKVEKALARFKLARQKNETMLQFEKRIRSESDQSLLEKISLFLNWFREYEKSRFSNDNSIDSLPMAPELA